MTVRLTNIQHFCLDDGPGIRTTIFLKGCSISCPWCCNPENISFEIEEYMDNGKKGLFGYDIGIDDLETEILKDEIYYETGGGLTISGGEPLLQIKDLEPLLKSLKEKDINICMETSLFAPIELLKIASDYVGEYYIDMKILNKDYCKTVLNGNIDIYFENLEYIYQKTEKITFRIPLVEEYTLDDENINLILRTLEKYPNTDVEIFKVHNLAQNKYNLLNKEYSKFSDLDDRKVQEIYNKINKINNNVEIIKL